MSERGLAVLFSYAFLRTSAQFQELVAEIGQHCQVMIDSGAFSNHQREIKAAASGRQPDLITIDEYNAFCHRVHGKVWQYVALDVLGDRVETERNLQAMLADGLKPMPVFVRGDTFDNAVRLVQYNEYLCLGGTVGVKGDYAVHRYQQVHKHTKGKAKIHALGFIQLPKVFQLPLYSCDASSWMAGGRWGNVVQYDPVARKMFATDRKRMSKPTERTKSTLSWLSDCGIGYDLVNTPEAWRKDIGVPSYCSVFTYLRMQAHARKLGRVVFMAVPDQLWFHNLLAVRATQGPRHYDYHRSLQVRAQLDALKKEGNTTKYHDAVCSIVKQPGVHL